MDSEFVAALRTLRTIPEEVLDSVELLEIMLPILRADFALAEGYVFREPPLECPISVLGGTEDHLVRYQALVEWRHHSQQPCAARMFPGDHFFLETARASVFRTVAHAVLPKMPSGEGGQGSDMTTRAGT